ncbi:MAG TPA: ABC transporter permease [Actinophytocola sp.]|uniref:ABC transporter permease n=1 Tax=Actinophytocola sp. TaxID=1872138 RepID=UPI002DB760F0|nr:ABC transporter permease [Actinophytocola sp.]HEU5470872.1 ABC transporter permease [Actinophytocola sp.]
MTGGPDRGPPVTFAADVVTYIIRRLIAAVILLFVVSAVTFAIFFLVPRIAGFTADDLASRYTGKTAGAEQTHEMAVKLGFTDPMYEQYGRFVKGLVAGRDFDTGPSVEHCPAPCFGYSFIKQVPVWPEIVGRMPVTLSLALGAAIIWLGFGIGTGVISALRRGTFFDRASMGIALAGVSLPIFFTGLLALSVFSYALDVTPPGGTDPTESGNNPLEWAHALLLPWITLAFLYSAGYARLTRAGMLETMNEDFIRTARAKGLTERRVVTKHGLRSALTPIVTIFGLDLGLLLGGAILTEKTFGLPGIGKWAVDSIQNNDLPVVLGVTMVGAFFVVIANLVVDLMYAVIDPRVRLG